MDAAAPHDPLADEQITRNVATPNPDSPGNLAWQRTMQLLEQVEEDERRRRQTNWRNN